MMDHYYGPHSSKTENIKYAPPKKRDKWLRKIMVTLFILNILNAIIFGFFYFPEFSYGFGFALSFGVGLFIFGMIGVFINIFLDLLYTIFKYPKNWE